MILRAVGELAAATRRSTEVLNTVNMNPGEAITAQEPVSKRSAAFDYLRSFGVLLVLLHHTLLGYVTFGFLNPYDPMKTWSPIVDSAKWAGFDRIVGANDTFFMPLLFLVSGLFVWQSLRNKGLGRFLLTRLTRLGIPFVLGVIILTPLAYFPTILEMRLVYGLELSFGQFVWNFIRAGFNECGPLWFISLLLGFDILVAAFYAVFSKLFSESNRASNLLLDNPVVFTLGLFALSIAAYIPMSDAFDVNQWVAFGPLKVQIVRLFVYALYFLAGVAMGARGLERGAFRRDGALAKYWWAWALAAAGAYAGLSWIFTAAPTSPWVRYIFLAEMALMVMGLTAVFIRFTKHGNRVLNHLSRNSYGIYLFHYLVIIWLQYAILRLDLSAGWKAAIVFVGGVTICWIVTAALRRIALVRKVI